MQAPQGMIVMVEFKSIAFLDLDHPGAKDPEYRRRRDLIAGITRQAREHGDEPPILEYTDEEHRVWATISRKLEPLHEKYANRNYLEARHALRIPADHIPQLRDLSAALERYHGFRLSAIEGLVDSRFFFGSFAEKRMACTQYIRHASRPEYTPEPDIIHEVIGHVPAFTDGDFCHLSELIGRAAVLANDRQLEQLERIYWFTIEFGLIRENAQVRAYGAGLLGSFGELQHVYSGEVQQAEFVLEDVIVQDYSHSEMQSKLFVIPSFTFLREQIERYVREYGLGDALSEESLPGLLDRRG